MADDCLPLGHGRGIPVFWIGFIFYSKCKAQPGSVPSRSVDGPCPLLSKQGGSVRFVDGFESMNSNPHSGAFATMPTGGTDGSTRTRPTVPGEWSRESSSDREESWLWT